MSSSGPSVPTLIERFYHWEATTPDAIFLRQPKGDVWNEFSYAQAGQEARKMVTALEQTGLAKGDHVAIFSKNCAHWILADLAIMMGGFVSVPLYASLREDQLEEVIQLGDVKAIFLGKVDDWGNRAQAIPQDVTTIRFPHHEGNAKVTIGDDWDVLTAESEPIADNYVPDLDDLWTIVFTSGTTGTPKGVMHSFRSPSMVMVDELRTGSTGIEQLGHLNVLSFLPLNHVGERIGLELPVIWQGGTMSFAESLASFVTNLQHVQPNMFFAVPRLWNKMYLAVSAKIPPQRLRMLLKTPVLGPWLKKKIRTGMGLRDVRLAATGASITPAYIKDWYRMLGIHLVEAYGMTELCGMISSGIDPETPDDSVGKAIPLTEVRADSESRELLLKTPYMMLGYYKSPDETAEVLIDGWMHSGDRGTVDDRGHIRVIGRLKDAFKTSKGKFVTPNPLEEFILQNDYVEQVCVAGLGLPQPIALLNLSEIGIAASDNDVEQSLRRTIQDLNESRARFEWVSTAVIQKEPWSVENGRVTPTLKVKRPAMDEQFGTEYLRWHESDRDVIWA